jgi:hypothetical protein
MKRRLTALSIVPLMLLAAGCASVQETAETAAKDAASGAATAAAGHVKKQVCAVVEDGLVSMDDKALLGSLVSGAETAGVPSDITTPLGQIAAAGDEAPAESVTALKEACSA